IGRCVRGISGDGALEIVDRFSRAGLSRLFAKKTATQGVLIRREGGGWGSTRDCSAAAQGGTEGFRNRHGHVRLNADHIRGLTVVALGPELRLGLGLDELSRNAQPIAGLSDAALEHVVHAEFSADLTYILCGLLV